VPFGTDFFSTACRRVQVAEKNFFVSVEMTDNADHGDSRLPAADEGIYGISMAAELTGAGTQSLRLWERHGLLDPSRSGGGTRRYSADDVDRLRRIIRLVDAGVNIAGIARILQVEDHNTVLRTANDALREANTGLEADNRKLREDGHAAE
jgi:MerR family transcriptional regulator/heat shock protein HspR